MVNLKIQISRGTEKEHHIRVRVRNLKKKLHYSYADVVPYELPKNKYESANDKTQN